MRRPLAALVFLALGVGGCPAGEGLPGGGLGPTLIEITPPIATTQSTLRLGGTGLGGDSVRVFFDDFEGEVLSASDTEVWVRGVIAFAGTTSVDVAVIIDGLPSNRLPLAIGASGDLRPLVVGGIESARGLVLDAGGGLVWILDEEAGVFVFAIANGAYRLHRAPSPELSQPIAGVAVSESEILVVDAATNSIVSMDVDSAEVTQRVSGLAAPPTALALDTAGNLYWADGGGSIGRQTAAGVVDPLFASVPAAFGVAVSGGALYATDPAAGVLHRLALPTAVVTSSFVAGLAGARGISPNDIGDGVVVCVDDAGGVGAVLVGDAGVTSVAAPERAVPAPGAATCENGSGTIWSLGADGGVESSKIGEAWRLRAPALSTDTPATR